MIPANVDAVSRFVAELPIRKVPGIGKVRICLQSFNHKLLPTSQCRKNLIACLGCLEMLPSFQHWLNDAVVTSV